MDESKFWDILDLMDWNNEGNDEVVIKPVIEYLSQMTDNEIFSFNDIMAKLLFDIDSREIAHSAYKSKEYFSEDLFLYLRCIAIVNGKKYYEKVKNGEIVLDRDLEFEAVLYIPALAWAKKHKKDEAEYPYLTKVSYETGSNTGLWK